MISLMFSSEEEEQRTSSKNVCVASVSPEDAPVGCPEYMSEEHEVNRAIL